MRLILTRHGQTVENVKGVMAGQSHGTLTEKGRQQATDLAERLSTEHIDAIYSSDLSRASETALAIAEKHPHTPLFLVPELREGDMGPYTGKPPGSIDWNNRPAGIETREAMRERSQKILDVARKAYPSGTVVFVAHNGINLALLSLLKGLPAEAMDRIEHTKNGAITVAESDDHGQWSITAENDTGHLAPKEQKPLLLHTDGGARGNPGPAAIGVVLFDQEHKVVAEEGSFLGEATNNVAEYRGLIRGMVLASRHGATGLSVFMDSELVVRQMRGEYRVKSTDLQPLFSEAKKLAATFSQISFTHVPRGNPYQQRADLLVNETLDAQARKGN